MELTPPCSRSLQGEALEPPSIGGFLSDVQICRKQKNLSCAERLHQDICKYGFADHRIMCNHIIPMLVECGSMFDSLQSFSKLVYCNEHSWTSVIVGHIEYGQSQHALDLYHKMIQDHVNPSTYTLVAVLGACAKIKNVEEGYKIHSGITERGLEKDIFVGTALIDMYAKCGLILNAQKIFDKLPFRNTVSWTALLAGYAEQGYGQEALRCFQQMRVEGIPPDPTTFVCILKACSSIGAIDEGREIHSQIVQNGYEGNVFIGNTLVHMYGKFGLLVEAKNAFDKLKVQNVVSWNSLISAYVENGFGNEALRCYEQMHLAGIFPNAVTFVCSLKACSTIGAIGKGHEIHLKIVQRGLERQFFVASTLIDMYATCGSVLDARNVFDKLRVRNVVLWNAMIRAYGVNHEIKMAINCFEEMQEQCIRPDAITFICLLTSCSRASLVVKGYEYLKLMIEKYGVLPTADHYTCMVDLLARSGHLYEAEKMFESAPCPPSKETLTALLSGCRIYGDTERGQKCFDMLVQMSPQNATPYILMGSILLEGGTEVSK